MSTTSSGSQMQRVSLRSPSEAMKPSAAPPPPKKPKRRKGGFLGFLSAVFTVGLFLAVLVGGAFIVVSRQSAEPGPLTADKAIVIPRDSGLAEIAEQLEREGVIRNTMMFRIAGYVTGAWSGLRAGEYLFKANISPREALDVLTSGRPVLHSILIPEGLTSEQIIARLRENELLTGDVTQIPREGALLPDTYRVERGSTRQRLLQTMAEKQREEMNRIWARRVPDLPIKTPQELVTLASIVEKETGRADERPRVAGVFVNRLNRRMKLQSDPTIVYGLVGGKGTLGRGILRNEITQPTPYNTYVIDGLPPGPIANPGRAAMEAVANPSRTRDLFFVADGTGGHAFGETLEQHNRNVARWRQIEASRREAGRPSAEASVDRSEPPPVAPGTPTAPATTTPGQPDRRTEVPLGFDAARSGLVTNADPAAADVETFPVPAGRRAGMSQPTPQPGRPAGATAPSGQPRPRAFDASEGTARDPLLNRNFDLNSAKVIPNIRP
ncbi:MAG: endolytic transglycosylase MltG [Hyphomicrobiales bacterium]|nr:endolytic transglycosylase MltG [Hyphomicrobiales bacterium]